MVPALKIGKKSTATSKATKTSNAPTAKAGAKDHFLGDQWTYLNKDGPMFIISQQDKKINIGKFYDNKAVGFIHDFGALPDTPADAAARLAPPPPLPETAEEIAARRANGVDDPPPPLTEAQRNANVDSKKFTRLRDVSNNTCEKVLNFTDIESRRYLSGIATTGLETPAVWLLQQLQILARRMGLQAVRSQIPRQVYLSSPWRTHSLLPLESRWESAHGVLVPFTTTCG